MLFKPQITHLILFSLRSISNPHTSVILGILDISSAEFLRHLKRWCKIFL